MRFIHFHPLQASCFGISQELIDKNGFKNNSQSPVESNIWHINSGKRPTKPIVSAARTAIKSILNELRSADKELTDTTIDYVLEIIRNTTDLKSQSTLIYYLDVVKIEPRLPNQTDVQVLYGGSYNDVGHWICTYFDATTKEITVFDSFFREHLDGNQRKVLQKLYPFLENIDDHVIYWEPTFYQTDPVSCGLFALSYLTSIAHNQQPEYLIFAILDAPKNVQYKHVIHILRRYFRQIIRAKALVPFNLKNFVVY